MDTSNTVIATDETRFSESKRLFDSVGAPVVEWPQELEAGGQLLEELFDDGTTRFVIDGGDELVGRVVTAYRRRRDLVGEPLEIWPLDVDNSYVARQAGTAIGAQRAAALLTKGADDWQRQQVGTLKVSASTQPGAWYGFSFAVGWVYRALETRRRARGGATNFVSAFGRLASDTLSEVDEKGVAHRVAVDHQPTNVDSGSLVVSTLGHTVFGLGGPGDGAVLWEQLPVSKLMRQAMTPDVLESSIAEGRPFDTVHLDSPDGWLLDGRLQGAEQHGVVQVTAGPTMTLVRPKTGLKAAVQRLWS